ncbi:uncharacterized protein LOC117177839 isoform X2 [Belonocnema kinseyi]|uniref:uncharacterized protein LOC117177839 isoform X2 n=1 Tax=Belonocnema kinseyi TaxID=2817044 RepID=UPI00143CFEF9|nr:uncharacterized protein LOC117177839 isoform X2 [Belonocnema kinseyi]
MGDKVKKFKMSETNSHKRKKPNEEFQEQMEILHTKIRKMQSEQQKATDADNSGQSAGRAHVKAETCAEQINSNTMCNLVHYICIVVLNF